MVNKKWKILLVDWEIEFDDRDCEYDSEFVMYDDESGKTCYEYVPSYYAVDPDFCTNRNGECAYATIDMYGGEIDSITIKRANGDWDTYYPSEIIYTNYEHKADYRWED